MSLFELEEDGKFEYRCWGCKHTKTVVGLQDVRRMKCSKCGSKNIGVRLKVKKLTAQQRRKLLKDWGWEPVQFTPIVLWDDGSPTVSSAGTGAGSTQNQT